MFVPSTSTSQNHPKVPFKKKLRRFSNPQWYPSPEQRFAGNEDASKVLLRIAEVQPPQGESFFSHDDVMRIPSRTPSGNRGKLGNPSLLHGRFSHVIPYHYPLWRLNRKIILSMIDFRLPWFPEAKQCHLKSEIFDMRKTSINGANRYNLVAK